jgi:transcriptional regulator with XRE-family HTH domain
MPRETPSSHVVEVHGYALRVIRQARGRGVANLAAALHVDRSYITHLENGSKLRVSPEFYAALLRELQIEDYRALLATAPLRDAAPVRPVRLLPTSGRGGTPDDERLVAGHTWPLPGPHRDDVPGGPDREDP